MKPIMFFVMIKSWSSTDSRGPCSIWSYRSAQISAKFDKICKGAVKVSFTWCMFWVSCRIRACHNAL